jgi:uroporphyrinogen decarboxylase
MSPRLRFRAALERKPVAGHVPHFELAVFHTMEVLGRVHPWHRDYKLWPQMSDEEKQLHRLDMAQMMVAMAEHFNHYAIVLNCNPAGLDEELRMLDLVLDLAGDRYFVILPGDATMAIPSGGDVVGLITRMAEEAETLEVELAQQVDDQIARVEKLKAHGGVDGLHMTSDYCLNSGPFLSPQMFDCFVMPHLTRLIAAYRQMGLYTIKHTDGNIMPILDRLLQAGPDALHSLDPQAGVDIAEVRRRAGDKVALCGNVNCGLLQTGSDEESVESARYALREGMKAPGYIFCTSNCVYTGMPLRRYELILDVWKREGIRRNLAATPSREMA